MSAALAVGVVLEGLEGKFGIVGEAAAKMGATISAAAEESDAKLGESGAAATALRVHSHRSARAPSSVSLSQPQARSTSPTRWTRRPGPLPPRRGSQPTRRPRSARRSTRRRAGSL